MNDNIGIEEKGYQPILYPQAEVDYTTNGTQKSPRGQICANCRWFLHGLYTNCQIVEPMPEPIVLTGWCSEWEAPPVPPEPDPVPVTVVGFFESQPLLLSEERSTGGIGEIFNTAKEAVLNMIGRGRGSEDFIKHGGFKAIGGGYWFAGHTNNFEDREKEILTEAAHDKFINRTRMKLVPMPELWFHHIYGTKHGVAKMIGRAGHMVYSVGKFDDTELGRMMEKEYAKSSAGTWGLSHGFTYPTWAKKGRFYEDYNTFEITTLRPEFAANLYTPFISLQELTVMPIGENEQKLIRESFPGKAGDMMIERANALEKAGEHVKALLGAAYKDYADTRNVAGEDTATKVITPDVSGVLLPQLMESQGDLMTLVGAMEKKHAAELIAMKATIQAQQAEITSLSKALSIPVTPASKADSTIVIPTDAERKAAELVLNGKKTGGQIDSIFPGMGIVKPD